MIHVLTSAIYTVCMHSKLTCYAWMKGANPVQVQEMDNTGEVRGVGCMGRVSGKSKLEI